MFRRDLLKSLFGLSIFGKRAIADDRGYIFDFTGSCPITDHPDYEDKITFGSHQDVYCDGVKMDKVLRFKTGPNGWVEGFVYKNGKYEYDIAGDNITRYKIHDNVVYVDRR